jgi:type IV secretion system protein VirB11
MSYLEQSLDHFQPYINEESLIELCVNPDGTVWIENPGDHYMHKTDIVLVDVFAADLANQISSERSNNLSVDNPTMSDSFYYKGRLVRAQVLIPPAVEKGASISLRFSPHFEIADIELEFLYGESQSSEGLRAKRNKKLYDVIKKDGLDAGVQFCVQNRLNIILSGGVSTGKTVTARKILSYVDPKERILTIEEGSELKLSQPNNVILFYDRDEKKRSAEIMLLATLRMRPDRIVLGEVRGKEAASFLEAIVTGHGGSLTTIHGESPQIAMARLATAASLGDPNARREDVLANIKRSVDVIIQTGKIDGKRGIVEFYLPAHTEPVDI